MKQRARGRLSLSPAWTALIVCCLGYYMVTFQRMSPGVMAAELKAEFSTTSAVLGLLSSIYFIVYAAMQIPVGYLADRYSPGRILSIFLGIAAVGAALFGSAPTLQAAIFARGLSSFGLSATFVISTKLFGQIFDKKGFILSTGLVVMAGNIGSMTASSPLAAMVDSMGWRATFFVMAVATAILAVVTLYALDRPEFRKQRPATGSLGRKGLSRRELLISLALGTAVFLKNGPLFSFQGLWGVPYLMDVHGLAKLDASLIVMIMTASAAVAGPIAGACCKGLRLSERHFLDVSGFLYAISWIPIAIVFKGAVEQSLWAAGTLFGLSSTFVAIMMQAVIKDSVDERGRGVSIGITNSMSILGGAVYQPLMGLMLDRSEEAGRGLAAGYSDALAFGMVSAGVAALLFVLGAHMAKGGKDRGTEGPVTEAAQ